MKTFINYLEDVAKEQGYTSVSTSYMLDGEILRLAREASKRYATAAIKEHLSRAAENATRFRDLEDENTRDLYESITNIDIELP